MNRNHLALFLSVAQHGGMTRGAAASRVSQPAVSKQVAELEAELGVALLERMPRGCRLTEAGRVLQEHGLRWLSAERDAHRAIDDIRGLRRGSLSIGASHTVGAYLLPGLLAEYHRRFPGIRLRVQIANTNSIRRSLLDGAVDLGLTEGPIESDLLRSTVFFEDELVAVGPSGHPFAARGSVTAKEFSREPLLLREEGSGTRAFVEQAFRRKGISLEPLLSLASPEAIKESVVAGLGLAVLSKLVVGAELRSGILELIPLRELRIRRPLHLQCVLGLDKSPPVTGFLELLEDWGPFHPEKVGTVKDPLQTGVPGGFRAKKKGPARQSL